MTTAILEGNFRKAPHHDPSFRTGRDAGGTRPYQVQGFNARILCALLFCLGCIRSFAAGPTPVFRAVEIDAAIQIGYGLAVADINGDKMPDIVLVDKQAVVWYENPTWRKHIMAEKLTVLDHVCVAAQDIDGDGLAEVAVGAEWNPNDTVNSGAVFYLIPPKDRTQRWEPVRLPHEPTVHRMRWVKNSSGQYDLVVVPLHGRGNKDGNGEGVKILAYHPPANPKDPWKTTLLDQSLHKTHNFDPVQWNSDAAQEMLVAGKEGIFLLEQGPKLTQLGGSEPGAGEIRSGKLKNGKRFIATVEPMHGNQCVIYTEPDKTEKLWRRQMIDDTLVDGHAVACGDILKAGHDQVVVGWRAMNQRNAKVGIRLYVTKDDAGNEWTQHLIDDNTMACEDLTLADFNNDGRLDIVAAGRATKNVKIYFNETKK